MPEYVYALHDFSPENPDEVSFKVGDRVEVIERDDLYGDGWWQGRNSAGQIGLFPQSYTSPTPPTSSSISFPDRAAADPPSSDSVGPSALQALREESETAAANGDSKPSPTESERERAVSQGDVMMHATLTDVQKAIEQLGRNDRDGARSFSFASSHGDYSEKSETETEDDRETDADDELGWHKDARAKLAERAQRENEQRQAQEDDEQTRISMPPIDFEVSDESDGEDDESPTAHPTHRQYPRIAEEDEEDEGESSAKPSTVTPGPTAKNSSDSIVPSERFLVPDETDLPTATAATFPETGPISALPLPVPANTIAEVTQPTPHERSLDPAPALAAAPVPVPSPAPSPAPETVPTPESLTASPKPSIPVYPVSPPMITPSQSTIKVTPQLPFSTVSALPSPTASSAGSFVVSNAAAIQPMFTPPTTASSFKPSTPQESGTSTPDPSNQPAGDPGAWTVEEVVEWLKSKGFDSGVCDKFTEQEITGDVLLDLDANILKSEIGIAAFGKRVRIVHAITELRRPPSIEEVEQQHAPITPRSLTHSFNYPMSHHSHPSHSHSHSIQSSAHQSFNNSPLGPPSPSVNGIGSNGIASLTSPESPPHTGDLPSVSPTTVRNGWRSSDPGSIRGSSSAVNLDETRGRSLIGLGLGLPSSKGAKSRPPQLSLSPSDSALGETVAIQDKETKTDKEERAVMSETESATRTSESKTRRRLFGRSADSTSLKDKSSIKDTASNHSAGTPLGSPLASASPIDDTGPVRRRSKGNKSVDERKPDRLSLFGSTFSGTLGKGRKPAPRLSDIGEKPEGGKHPMSTFSRLREKRSTSRPGTSDGTSRHADKEKKANVEQEKEKEKDKKDRAVSLSSPKERDPTLLRKRTSSTTDPATRATLAAAQASGGPTLQAGQSILEQIGTPDHNGWLRKKGDRYNTWKLRYFVLKGTHLYWLRSNKNSETKIKGYLNTEGYKVFADEKGDSGRYAFRLVHKSEKPHQFSSDEQSVLRGWMKALMKATITRDYTNPVMSSCNIPTIPLTVAQAMNPPPRPPSPNARAATQKAMRRENPSQLSSRDAQVLLMGMPNKNQNGDRARLDSFFTNDAVSTNEPESPVTRKAPPRPSRELRRASTSASQAPNDYDGPLDKSLMEWANSHLPSDLQIKDPLGPLCGGLALLRLAENIKGNPASPPIPDSAFPSGTDDDKLDGLFKLFDYLLDNDVKLGSVSINDVRQGRRDKIIQLLRALKAWEDRRMAIAQSIGNGTATAGPFISMSPLDYNFKISL